MERVCDVAMAVNMYIDGVLREGNARVQGISLPLVDANGREWIMNQLQSADDTALLVESEKGL